MAANEDAAWKEKDADAVLAALRLTIDRVYAGWENWARSIGGELDLVTLTRVGWVLKGGKGYGQTTLPTA